MKTQFTQTIRTLDLNRSIIIEMSVFYMPGTTAEPTDLIPDATHWAPEEVIAWAVDAFAGCIVTSSSFQQQSLPLLHMISRLAPEMPVLFCDTGYHLPETLAFKEQIRRHMDLNVIEVYPTPEDNEPDLWRQSLEQCCYLNKVLPMQQVLTGYRAWITGIRHDQSTQRAQARVIERRADGLIKINPILSWTETVVQHYIACHHLPMHPLYEMGYRSIGCAPCTRPIAAWEDERAGRWPGRENKECGLHTLRP